MIIALSFHRSIEKKILLYLTTQPMKNCLENKIQMKKDLTLEENLRLWKFPNRIYYKELSTRISNRLRGKEKILKMSQIGLDLAVLQPTILPKL